MAFADSAGDARSNASSSAGSRSHHLLASSDRFFCETVADDARGYAPNDRIGRYVLCNDCVCADDRAGADAYATQHRGLGADPDVMPKNSRRSCVGSDRLPASRHIAGNADEFVAMGQELMAANEIVVVMRGTDLSISCNGTVSANLRAISNIGVCLYISPRADFALLAQKHAAASRIFSAAIGVAELEAVLYSVEKPG